MCRLSACLPYRKEYDKPSHGFCKMPYNAVIARATLHMWEEPVISGKNGSGAIFFPDAHSDVFSVKITT